jgi:hypothetical protein
MKEFNAGVQLLHIKTVILHAHMPFSLYSVQQLVLLMMDYLVKQSPNFIWSIWLEGALCAVFIVIKSYFMILPDF